MECICGTEIPQERLIVQQKIRGVGDLKGVTVKKKTRLTEEWSSAKIWMSIQLECTIATHCAVPPSNSFLGPNSQEHIFRGAACWSQA